MLRWMWNTMPDQSEDSKYSGQDTPLNLKVYKMFCKGCGRIFEKEPTIDLQTAYRSLYVQQTVPWKPFNPNIRMIYKQRETKNSVAYIMVCSIAPLFLELKTTAATIQRRQNCSTQLPLSTWVRIQVTYYKDVAHKHLQKGSLLYYWLRPGTKFKIIIKYIHIFVDLSRLYLYQ